MTDQTTIRITRAKSLWRDRARRYRVLVDGSIIGSIRNGRTEDFEVAPGNHHVQLKIDWLRSTEMPVAVGMGEVVAVTCRPGAVGPTGLRADLGRKPLDRAGTCR